MVGRLKRVSKAPHDSTGQHIRNILPFLLQVPRAIPFTPVDSSQVTKSLDQIHFNTTT